MGSCRGSAVYTPSMFLAMRMASTCISMARSATAVSVEKKGLPLPAANSTMRPSARCLRAAMALKGSAKRFMSTADCTTASSPAWRRASATHRQLITVPSMPIWSAVTASMWAAGP